MIAPRRLLVVSHPSVIAVNQLPYEGLRAAGWDVHLVVPGRWKDDYRPEGFSSEILPGLRATARTPRVLLAGAPQRHVYLAFPGRILDAIRPNVVFLEQEPFAMVTAQWLGALRRRGIPFGLQHDENLDRVLPRPAAAIRALSLPRAAFVAARSPRAAELLVGARTGLRVEVVPHAVPGWPAVERPARGVGQPFTVGYAGRLIEAKGIRDLLAATALVGGGTRLLVAGNGELRDEVSAASTSERPVDLRPSVPHADMPALYAEMDVLVLPSRTTPTWSEQFGRVLVEAMSCGVPVIASDSGEMPWVVGATGGGLLFREGSVSALAERLVCLRNNPALATSLAEAGRASVNRTFSEAAVTNQLDKLFSYVWRCRVG